MWMPRLIFRTPFCLELSIKTKGEDYLLWHNYWLFRISYTPDALLTVFHPQQAQGDAVLLHLTVHPLVVRHLVDRILLLGWK